MIARRKGHRIIPCNECGVEILAYGTQKYCRACSDRRHSARQSKWRKQNPLSADAVRRGTQRQKEVRVTRGLKTSAENASSISWDASASPALGGLIRIALPFSYGMSKNRLWSMASGGSHVYMRAEIRNTKHSIAMMIQSAMKAGPVTFVPGKVWLDILVQKPNHRGDAVNVIDLVCDAVKVGIGVDDRWFSIRRLDWEIVKENPKIFIGIGQDVTEEQRICSMCGQSRPITSFPGHRRCCVHCSRASRVEKETPQEAA